MTDQIITVGVDGSKSSLEALRFALDEAQLRDATVRAVTAWQVQEIYAADSGALFPEERAGYELARPLVHPSTRHGDGRCRLALCDRARAAVDLVQPA
jgi:nucleotide-binding universal stress UspA family protein